MRRLIGRSALVLACVGCAVWSTSRPALTQSAPSFGVTDLGPAWATTSSATGLMSGGFPGVIGACGTSSGAQHACRGNAWGLSDQGTLGGTNSALLGISPQVGYAVGWSDTSTGAVHAIVAGSPLQDLGTLGGTNSVATAVNDNRLVVGYSDVASGPASHAFIYDLQAGAMSDLGASLGGPGARAFAINKVNHVAGYADLPGGQVHHAFLFANGSTADLGAFGTWSEAYGINDSDVVVGAAGTGNGQHAFVFAGSMQDLGTLGGLNSAALAVSNAGVVVGWAEDGSGTRRAVMWTNGVIQDLNSLIPPGTGWLLASAQGLQVGGGAAIVGYGTLNGATHAFLLTPPIDITGSTQAWKTGGGQNSPNPIEAGQRLFVAASFRTDAGYSLTGLVFTHTFTGPVRITGWSGADSCNQPDDLHISCYRRAADFTWENDIFITTTAAGAFTHSMSVAADQPDPNPSDNSGSESNTAVSLQSLTTSQSVVTAGQQSLSRATLTSTAPSGGASVKLASSNPSVASVPSTFDVLPGCCDNGTWREFYITTYPVSSPTTVQISATYGLVTKTVSITVVPPNTSYPYTGSAAAIPGTIEAENFDVGSDGTAYHDTDAGNNGGAYRNTDVDIEAASDAGGGYDVGWIAASEWLAYTVNVASSGTYQLEARVASPGAGGTFHVEFDGTSKTGTMQIPDSGGWQSWTTVSAPVSLTAGSHVMRVSFDSNGVTGSVGNLNWIRLTAVTASGSTPFGGTARSLPGIVQAEDFDDGGAAVAYVDTTSGNSGGQYRSTDVDIEATSDSGGGFDVGWIAAGEWLKYSVNATAGGSYTLSARVASVGQGGTFHVEMDGTGVTGPMTIPDTGGWQNWTTLSVPVNLTSGAHVMRVVFDSGGVNAVGNLNWIQFTAATGGTSTPFTGQPIAIPGHIEAENFDNGGEGVAYHDTDAANNGGQYRQSAVDIEATSDTGGGYDVGWMTAGEWLNYTVNVGQAGTYWLRARVAANGPGGTFHIEANGSPVTGALTIPETGGWQSWSDVTATITLNAGIQVLRFVEDANGSTGVFGNLNYFEISASTASAAANIVFYSGDFSMHGSWALQPDATAAAGQVMLTPDRGWSTPDAPLAGPTDYVDVTFQPVPNTPYTIWLRVRATADSKYNDSVWVQFSDAAAGGGATYQIGSTSGLLVNLEPCSGCGTSGWGWQNTAYWLSQATTLTFPSGAQTMRIQVREDGAQIDQVVLSPSQYLGVAPGPVKNDATVVPK